MTTTKHRTRRPGGGRKKEDPALVAARNLRAGRRLMREQSALQTEAEIDAWLQSLLLARLADAGLPPDASDHDWHCYHYIYPPHLAAGWREHGAEVLARWIARRPGTRPSCWWKLDAPRISREFIERCPEWGEQVLAECHVPRLRVAGDGERIERNPYVECGFPTSWWTRVNAGDPPRFESQAAYLRRLKLLAPGEAQRLKAADFEPEPLPKQHWPKQEEKTNDQ
jgi:hypothetical protein